MIPREDDNVHDAELSLLEILGTRVRQNDDTRLSSLLMRSFPCTVGRVDFRKARNVVERAAPPERAHGANSPDSPFETKTYVVEVISFLDECLRSRGLNDAWVAFVGEGLSHEYEVERTAVADLLTAVAEEPDHKYIFGLDGSWCFMWSFEDDLYFGQRPER